jgi:hypothetical protein
VPVAFAVGVLEHTPRGQVCRTFGACRLISSIFDKRGIHQFVETFWSSGADQQLPLWLKSVHVRAEIIKEQPQAQPKKKPRTGGLPPWRRKPQPPPGPPPAHLLLPPAHTEEDDDVDHGGSGGSGDSPTSSAVKYGPRPPSTPPPEHILLAWYKDDTDKPEIDEDDVDEDEYEAVQNMPLPEQGAWQCDLCANLNLRSVMMCSVCAQVRAKEEDATDCNASASLNL